LWSTFHLPDPALRPGTLLRPPLGPTLVRDRRPTCRANWPKITSSWNSGKSIYLNRLSGLGALQARANSLAMLRCGLLLVLTCSLPGFQSWPSARDWRPSRNYNCNVNCLFWVFGRWQEKLRAVAHYSDRINRPMPVGPAHTTRFPQPTLIRAIFCNLRSVQFHFLITCLVSR